MKKSYVLGIFAVLIFACLIAFNLVDYKEGILPTRNMSVLAIALDNTIAAKTKIDMIRRIQIGDSKYANIINNTKTSDDAKVKALLNLSN